MRELLLRFMEMVACDPRIGASHITVYCALLQLVGEDVEAPVFFKSRDVMRYAKIGGSGTYHRLIRDLGRFGYLDYHPSYNHRKDNKAYFLCDYGKVSKTRKGKNGRLVV